MNLPQRLSKCRKTLGSSDLSVLSALADELEGILSDKDVNEENRACAKELGDRTALKICNIAFRKAAEDWFDHPEKAEKIEEKTYKFCNDVLSSDAVKDDVKKIAEYLCDVVKKTSDYARALNLAIMPAKLCGSKECDAAAESVLASGIPERLPSYFADVCKQLKRRAVSRARCAREDIMAEKFGAVYYNFEKTPEKFERCAYYPSVLDDPETLSDITVICTHDEKEAELLYSKSSEFGKNGCVRADALLLVPPEDAEEAAEYCFRRFEDKCPDSCLVLGMNRLKDSGVEKAVYRAAAKLSVPKVFISDTSPSVSVYKRMCEEDKAKDRLSFLYLSVPDYEDTVKLFEDFGYPTSPSDYADIKKYGAVIGFLGLNEVLNIGGESWRGELRRVYKSKREAFENFVTKLAYPLCVIDSGWGYVPLAKETKLEAEKRDFDYDKVPEMDRGFLREILESDCSFRAKCGAAVNYIILRNEDVSTWETLSDADKEERITDATLMLAQLLQTQFVPIVYFDYDKKTYSGLCVGGGAEIRYCMPYLYFRQAEDEDDKNWVNRVILHEMYHSFQYSCKLKGIPAFSNEWGLSYKRVKYWKKNDLVYTKLEDDRPHYEVQILEADAEIFSMECCAAAKEFLNHMTE